MNITNKLQILGIVLILTTGIISGCSITMDKTENVNAISERLVASQVEAANARLELNKLTTTMEELKEAKVMAEQQKIALEQQLTSVTQQLAQAQANNSAINSQVTYLTNELNQRNTQPIPIVQPMVQTESTIGFSEILNTILIVVLCIGVYLNRTKFQNGGYKVVNNRLPAKLEHYLLQNNAQIVSQDTKDGATTYTVLLPNRSTKLITMK